MVVARWDCTDRRIFGKIASCERRKCRPGKRRFWPSVRLIAHDLSLPRSTVQDRLQRLVEQGAIVVQIQPKGFTYHRLTATEARTRRWSKCRNPRNAPIPVSESRNPDTPPLRGEAQALGACRASSSGPKTGAGVRFYRTKDPPDVAQLASKLLHAGLRQATPEPIRHLSLRKLARGLIAKGLTHGDASYLVWRARSARKPAALLGFWLGSCQWKAVLLDRRLGKQAAAENRVAQDAAERAHRDDWMRDYPDLATSAEPVHIGAGIDGALAALRRR